MHRYPIRIAAQLADASYTADEHPSTAPRLARSLDRDDVQAHLLDNGLLLIPGSNSIMDYVKFNLRAFSVNGTRFSVDDDAVERGASGTLWHLGFLRHAQAIYDWVEGGDIRPTFIVGHSLGAASAQILTISWKVNGVAFAAPRPMRRPSRSAPSRFCLCVNRDDDPVPGLPRWFRHIGRVHVARAAASRLLPRHSMRHYVAATAMEQRAGRLPVNWPPLQTTSMTPLSTAST